MKMNKEEYEDFLERGWEVDGSLFYKGFIYFSSATGRLDNDEYRLCVYKFEAVDNGNGTYSAFVTEHDFKSYEDIIDKVFYSREEAKMAYFKLKMFEGKTFFEVVEELRWLDDSGIQIKVE